jgi:hypothetical protein
MKIKRKNFILMAIFWEIFLVGCKTPSPANVEGTKHLKGLDYKLVAQYKPLHLYIYAETASTNQHPDFVIFQRNEPLIFTDSKSNFVEISLCEKNFRGQLVTRYNYDGQILQRSFCDFMQTNYLYLDTNADGLWDGFIIDEGKNGIIKTYDQSNLCWIPRK